MSAAKNYKYTDEQVAADWNLFCSLASVYVANYEGTFELLVSYKHRVRCGYDLTVPMVRATMNCMLRDASIVNLPEPAGPGSNVTSIRTARSFKDYFTRRHSPSYFDEDYGRGPQRDPDDEDEVVEIQRPRYVEMPIKWRHDYGIVLHKMSRVVHRVHPDSYAKWDTETNAGSPVIWWRCKGYRGAYQMGKSKIIIMDSLEAAIHIMQSGGQLTPCRRCRELADGQQVLVDEVLALVDHRQVGTADMHPLQARHPSTR
jgi:hypothetical protein